jgi:hypothetical protein
VYGNHLVDEESKEMMSAQLPNSAAARVLGMNTYQGPKTIYISY